MANRYRTGLIALGLLGTLIVAEGRTNASEPVAATPAAAQTAQAATPATGGNVIDTLRADGQFTTLLNAKAGTIRDTGPTFGPN